MGVIEDGAGQGFVARVNSDNRLYVFSDSVPAGTIAAAARRHWSISTDDFTLTNDGRSAALFLRYTGSQSLIVNRITVTTGASTGGSGNTVYGIWKNPTGGTIMDSARAATVENRNFSGTAGSLSGLKYLGAQGETLTGDEPFANLNITNTGVFTLDVNENPYVLENGNAIAVSITPPSGNTSQTNRVFVLAYELVIS